MSLTSSIVAAYKFSSGAITTDSKASYTLTNVNTVPTASDGKDGYCADCGTSNTTKYLYRQDAYGMLGSTAKTYSFWWKIKTAPSSGTSQLAFRHLYGGSAVGNYANVVYRNTGGVYEVVMPTSPGAMVVTQTLTVDTWYHFAVTVPASNTGNLTCYLNGSSLGTTANWSQNYGLTTQLGLFSDHGGGSISPNEIDEFYVFNEVLSGADITTLAAGTSGSFYPFTSTNIKSYNTNTYANIKSINGNLIANVKSLNTNV